MIRKEHRNKSAWVLGKKEQKKNGREGRHIDMAATNYNLQGISAQKESQKKITAEKERVLSETFGARYDMARVWRSINAIDIISKHRPELLLSSEKLQRKLRQYFKLLIKFTAARQPQR